MPTRSTAGKYLGHRTCVRRSEKSRPPGSCARPNAWRGTQEAWASLQDRWGPYPPPPAVGRRICTGTWCGHRSSSHPGSSIYTPTCVKYCQMHRALYCRICKVGNIAYPQSEIETETGRIRTSTGHHSIVLVFKGYYSCLPVLHQIQFRAATSLHFSPPKRWWAFAELSSL